MNGNGWSAPARKASPPEAQADSTLIAGVPDILDALEVVLGVEHAFQVKVADDNIAILRSLNSIVDYVFRALGVEYLHRDELAQVPPERTGLPEPPKGAAVDAGYQPELVEALSADGIETPSSFFVMVMPGRTLLFADCAVRAVVQSRPPLALNS